MSVPDVVGQRYALFTLACRTLLSRMPDLAQATLSDLRVPLDTCLRHFDAALETVLSEAHFTDLEGAVRVFAVNLAAKAELFSLSNESAATIFREVTEECIRSAADWDFVKVIEGYHKEGRDLARAMFADAKNTGIRERLGIECQVAYEYDSDISNDRVALQDDPFGYKLPPMSYYRFGRGGAATLEPTHTIVTRLGCREDSALFFSYPFLFVHEYTAHVYSTDYGNERFNDGWMLAAASSFMFEDNLRSSPDLLTRSLQCQAFEERLLPGTGAITRQSHRFAIIFRNWLRAAMGPDGDSVFRRLTFELAAFEPQGRIRPTWPDQALYELQQSYYSDAPGLLKRVERHLNQNPLLDRLLKA